MVAHFALVAVRPQFPSVDVVLSEGSGDPFALHVVSCVFPRKVPSLSYRFERVNASVAPFSRFPACNESDSSLFRGLVGVGPRSSLSFRHNGSHNGIQSDLGAGSVCPESSIVKDNPNILRLHKIQYY